MYGRVLEFLDWQNRDKDDLRWFGMPDPELPDELALHYNLEHWGNPLLVSGGYFDQPYALMEDLRVVRKAIRDWGVSRIRQEADKAQYDEIAKRMQS